MSTTATELRAVVKACRGAAQRAVKVLDGLDGVADDDVTTDHLGRANLILLDLLRAETGTDPSVRQMHAAIDAEREPEPAA